MSDLWNERIIEWECDDSDFPVLTANRQQDEPWRIERLKRVVRTFRQLVQIVHHKQLPGGVIVQLHDHKGDLTATVSSEEWVPLVQRMMDLAWEAEGEAQCETVSA